MKPAPPIPTPPTLERGFAMTSKSFQPPPHPRPPITAVWSLQKPTKTWSLRLGGRMKVINGGSSKLNKIDHRGILHGDASHIRDKGTFVESESTLNRTDEIPAAK